jgi:tRNA 2-thiouridine synthesizing protein E
MTVATVEYAGKAIELDADEHLANVSDWTEDVAAAIAEELGIFELTEDHWKVINFMRKVFEEDGDAPSIRRLTKESGVDTKTLYKLFPKGPAKKAAKVAGLPKPKGCI